MLRDILKWAVPGLVTVLAGSTLALAMTSSDIADDVASQSTAMVQRAGFDWAELSFAMRDLTLSGTTTDQQNVEAARQRLALIPGVRSVSTDVTLAPIAAPYRFDAVLTDGKIALSGGVPDETTRQNLLTRAGLEQGGLQLRSGMPERRAWIAGAQFAIDQLRFFDQAEASMSDLRVDLVGRAKSERDFRDLLIVLRAGPPVGVTLGDVKITPALVSPYLWNAVSDGKRIEVSGYVPDDALVERYRTAETAGLPVATGLALGSGEPDDFADISQLLIEQLSRLEYGTASIVDGQSSLSGAPATLDVAQAVTQTLQSAGSIVVLDPPRIDDYWASATLQPGGAVIFDGYAPDAATRDALQARPGANTQNLQLGRGAPQRYQSAMDFGLGALSRLSEGRFALRQNVLTITGVARSGDDYKAVLTTLAEQAPQGFVLARAEIAAPAAANYQWSARKTGSGAIALSGMVPSADAAATLLAAAGPSASQALSYASGEPRNFITSAQTGLRLLDWLNEGQVVLDGNSWTVTGSAKSAIDKAAIEADFVSRKLAGAGWALAVAAPPSAPPVADPYTWSATSTAAAGVALAGHVPDASVRQALASHGGGRVADASKLASGAPAGFAAAATAALDAVVALGDAEVQFDGASWTLTGQAPSGTQRDEVLAALAAATDISDWSISVDAPEAVAAGPYLWSAIKSATGVITVTGSVPDEALREAVAERVGSRPVDQTRIDPAAPAGFAADVLAAIDALAQVSDGLASFDGAQWRVDGNLREPQGTASVTAALASAATPAAAWNLTLLDPAPAVEAVAAAPETAAPEPAAPETPAVEAPEPAPATVDVDPAYAFSASRDEAGAVILSGQVPADAALRQLTAITEADTAAVSIAAGAPETFMTSAETGLRALLRLQSGQLDFADGSWRIAGVADDATERDAVVSAIAADTAGDWSVAVDAPAAPVEAEVVAIPPAATRQAKVDISTCAGPIADFSGRNAILFQSGAAIIAKESEAAFDELIPLLDTCPDAVIHVEGHTDADGDAGLNLALSVARAEAVVQALIDKGVNPQRLYALGYGETRPIADNATAAGKSQNRRIVVTVTDEHF